MTLADADFGGNVCAPIKGSAVLSVFSLIDRSRWLSLGCAALSIPVLSVAFFLGVRTVRHEHR